MSEKEETGIVNKTIGEEYNSSSIEVIRYFLSFPPLLSLMSSERLAGVLIPLFSMRRQSDHGIGDVTALREWIDWAFENHVGFLQLLPINALGRDETPSPYSAISSIALEPLYLSLEPWVFPGLKERIDFNAVDAPNSQYPSDPNLVDYPKARQFKMWVFRQCWLNFQREEELSPLREEFAEWCDDQDNWLEDFASFKVLGNLFGTDAWWQWPEQDVDKARVIAEGFADEKNFEKWLQWLSFRQFEAVRTYANQRGVALMGDIPIGVSMASSDVFFQRHLFDTSWFGGAPAEGDYADDPFTAKWGQNWGIPLYRWDVMAHDNYAWWRRRIQYTARIFAIYRIDHILGFYRIYSFPWMPDQNQTFLNLSHDEAAIRTGGRLPGFLPRADHTAWDRKLNLMNGDRYLQVLLTAAPGVRVVGEDLGCVPDYVRPNMQQLRIAGFKIPHWEIKSNGKIVKGSEYNPCSFATYGTHDFNTIMETWNDAYQSISKARDAGIYAHGVLTQPKDDSLMAVWREADNGLRLLDWFADYAAVDAKSVICPWNDQVKDFMFRALLASKANYAALMWTELFDIDERLNTPGTVGGTNWRWRMSFTAHEALAKTQSTWYRDVVVETERYTPLSEELTRTLKQAASSAPFPILIDAHMDVLMAFLRLPH
ncbi:MAG: 4-alpha-glucanotransferase [Akkermansia sp.]